MTTLHRWLWALLVWISLPFLFISYLGISQSSVLFSLLAIAGWGIVFLGIMGYGYHLLAQTERNAQTLAKTNADQDWVKDGLADLSAQLSQTENLKDLLNTAISALARYTSAGKGAIYLFDEAFEYFYLKAGYAITVETGVTQSFNLGEGIVGQVGLERTPILLQNIQEQNQHITTALLNAQITNTYTYPLIYKDQLVGVIELGATDAFDPIKRSYLLQSISILSAAIFAAQKADDTTALLQQTRRQAKELELKADEVERQNIELAHQKQVVERQAREVELQNIELEQQRFETEKKAQELERAQVELKKQNDTLAQAQKELKIHAEELAFSNKYKAEFLANMSHELRTPLNAINVLAGLLRKNTQRNLTPKQLEQLHVIHYSGRDLLDMINDLLDLSKIEAGQMSISLERVNIVQLAQELKAMFDPLVAEKPIRLTLNAEDNLPLITTDKAKIRQVIKNFLSNALKFTEEGKIDIQLHQGDAQYPVWIKVQDSGIGISEDKLGDIFEHFRQADGSTARKYGGTGLGLSISRELAVMLGGKIVVESVEHQGSTFMLALPEQPDVSQLEEHLIDIVQNNANNTALVTQVKNINDEAQTDYETQKTILLIDDDIIFANLLMTQLSKMGYHFLHANNGREGLMLAKEQQPDGILLDRKMPLIGGDETLKLLKRDPVTRHIPVDILSGDAPDIMLKRCGAVAVWQKPLAVDQLEQAIEGLLSVSRGTPEVVIIEDNLSMQEGLQSLLTSCIPGITLHIFNTAETALQYLDHTCPTVVVIDLGLPNIQGLEMVDLVISACPNVPIIIYTSRDLRADEIKQLREFTDTIILKASDSMLRLANEITLFLHRRITLVDDCKEKAKAFEPSGGSLLGKRVLLVDDDVRNLFSLSAMLEEVGIETITANHATEGLRLLNDRQQGIQLVLTDIMMPEMDGYELIKTIRETPAIASTPIVALTARVGSEEKERCLAIGADDYISKPVDEGLLIQILRYWLASK